MNSTDIECQMQAIECNVKLITQTSSKVYEHEWCGGFIRAILSSCATMLQFDTKWESAVYKSAAGSG